MTSKMYPATQIILRLGNLGVADFYKGVVEDSITDGTGISVVYSGVLDLIAPCVLDYP